MKEISLLSHILISLFLFHLSDTYFSNQPAKCLLLQQCSDQDPSALWRYQWLFHIQEWWDK